MGRSIITFQHSAQHTTYWTVEEDAFITGIGQTGTIVISRQTTDTTTNEYFTPTANRVLVDSILMGSNSTVFKSGLLIPVLKGEVILVTTSAAGSVGIYLDSVDILASVL
jgi:hypothetical protein